VIQQNILRLYIVLAQVELNSLAFVFLCLENAFVGCLVITKRCFLIQNFITLIGKAVDCTLRLISTQENYPWIGTDKNIFLCFVSSGLELMTLTQRKIVLSVPIHG
jgi:hypothetical protein